MRKSFVWGLAALLLAFSPSGAKAGLVVKQFWSPAPNAYGSPSWGGYVANAQTGIQGGGVNVGDRNTDPTGYEILSTFTPGDMMVTSFTSWRGVAGPLAPFAGEYGNRLHVGASIISDTAFTLADVTFDYQSSDGSLNYSGDLAGTNFGTGSRVGVWYGANGVLGGGDDVIYNTSNIGNDSVLINELYYVGVGNAFWPGGDLTPPSSGTQADIDATAAYILANVSYVTNKYCVRDRSCDTSTLYRSDVPEPPSASTFGLGLAGLVGLGLIRRRRSAMTAAA